jgi:hypothetical protein
MEAPNTKSIAGHTKITHNPKLRPTSNVSNSKIQTEIPRISTIAKN